MWNERYTNEFAAYGIEPNDFLREVAAKIPKGPVLCLAEGEGRNAVFLAKMGYDVTAVDLSSVGLANAKKLAAKNGVELTTIEADLAQFDLGQGKWAGIVSIWAHMPSQVRSLLHQKCVQALLPGGAMVLEAYTPRQLEMPGQGGPPSLDLLMSADALRQELKGLEFEVCREVDRDVQEGLYHRGLSATVQVVGLAR